MRGARVAFDRADSERGSTPTTAPLTPGGRLLGSLPEMKRDILAFTEKAYAACGDLARVSIGPPGLRFEALMVNHPEGAARVLAGSNWTNFRKEGGLYDEIRALLGNGLLTSQDEDWTRQRRFVQPLFTRAHVDGYAQAMVAEIELVLDDWRKRGVSVLDLGDELTRMTLRVVTRVLFGDDAGLAYEVIRRDFPIIDDAVMRRGISPLNIPIRWPTPLNRRAITAQSGLYDVCNEIVAHRRASRSPRRDDLLALLLAARDEGEALTDSEVRDQILIFLLAGHETTSTALTFTLHLLGRHPDVQDRVRSEVMSVIGDQPPTAEHVRAMTYTTAALQEALRLYPSAPLIGRRSVADDEICGYHVPAETEVAVVPWVIHRRADLWPDPLRYDPARFVPPVPADRHRYAWMPFGGGPRGCIGQHFSITESVLALAMIVRGFTLEAVGDSDHVPVDSAITIRPVQPVLSRVAAR
jgi:cytochrome P450